MSRVTTFLWVAALWLAVEETGFAQQSDAISREVSVFNDLTNPVVPSDAVSREISVMNNLSPPVLVADAISREVAIFNDLSNPVVPGDADSREISASNAFGCPTALHGNLSGNLTDDGLVTPADIPAFVNVLIGVITDPYLRQAADVNCDGLLDGEDIIPFVALMMTP